MEIVTLFGDDCWLSVQPIAYRFEQKQGQEQQQPDQVQLAYHINCLQTKIPDAVLNEFHQQLVEKASTIENIVQVKRKANITKLRDDARQDWLYGGGPHPDTIVFQDDNALVDRQPTQIPVRLTTLDDKSNRGTKELSIRQLFVQNPQVQQIFLSRGEIAATPAQSNRTQCTHYTIIGELQDRVFFRFNAWSSMIADADDWESAIAFAEKPCLQELYDVWLSVYDLNVLHKHWLLLEPPTDTQVELLQKRLVLQKKNKWLHSDHCVTRINSVVIDDAYDSLD